MKRGSRPIDAAFRQWAGIYRSFTQERFDKFSKGGGDWPKLKPETIKRRKDQSSVILVDTATLKGAIQPDIKKPGRFDKKIQDGIAVGYGGPDKHPKGKGKATIAAIAAFHDTGAGRLPTRKIIVEPDRKTVRRMIEVMEVALDRAAR